MLIVFEMCITSGDIEMKRAIIKSLTNINLSCHINTLMGLFGSVLKNIVFFSLKCYKFMQLYREITFKVLLCLHVFLDKILVR